MMLKHGNNAPYNTRNEKSIYVDIPQTVDKNFNLKIIRETNTFTLF